VRRKGVEGLRGGSRGREESGNRKGENDKG
jgi:hypothetical protein